ncbi:MAG: hypothetical protein WCN27_05600, partial [Alphaproteobacteria bacterium]
MSLQYTDVPPGGVINVPPAIPNGMLYRVKQIQNISKQTLKLVPISGQVNVSNSQKIIVSLPPNSLVDLSTFEMNFLGATKHLGNGVVTNCANYVQKAYFPRNTASLIENLEIKINGQSRQNINQYGYLFNILYDFTCGHDAVAKNRIGCNADPSNKTTYYNGQPRRYSGYPQGCTTDTSTNAYLDQDNYTIRQWLGILGGNASTSIIDTSLYGDITIEITLAPSDVLMLSSPIGTLATLASTTNAEVGIATTVGAAAALNASQGIGYTLSNIGFQITRYDMPSSYYQAVASVLEAGAVFKLYYPNYSVFMGSQQSLPKGGTTRFNISTQSLDMVISTFQVQDRGINQAPILGSVNTNYIQPNSDLATYGEFGSSLYNFNTALVKGVSKTLNNSKYFVRNGDGIAYSTYIVGAVRLIPETIPEQFNGVLRAWNSQNDTLGGLYPGIQSLAHYQTQFYSHILSLNVTNEHDMYTVSGLNCSATPISIALEVAGSTGVAGASGSGTVQYIDNAATSNGNIWQTSNWNSTPIMYALYTSRLEISAGR